jgi:septin 7
MPFAVIGSNTILEIDGKKMRVRQYPWITIPIESEDTSDFLALRTMLIRTHMEDIKESLQTIYELYRSEHLIERQARTDSIRVEGDMRIHEAKMQKMEQEMLAVFQQKVADKETKLKNSEAEVCIHQRVLTM